MGGIKINESLVIPEHELIFEASRSGGPGGQHVNKTSSRITLRWNLSQSQALSPEQKALLLQRLTTRLTTHGELIVHVSTSRSQHENRLLATERLIYTVNKALAKPKKRKATRVPTSVRKQIRATKSLRSKLKQLRKKTFDD